MTGIPITVGELIDTPTINTWARGYLRKTTSKTVSGTTAPTDLLNGEFTVPAGALSTNKVLRLSAWGDWKQNVSATNCDVPDFRVASGGTLLIATGGANATAVAHDPSRYGWRIVCEIMNRGAANSQWVSFWGATWGLPNSASTGTPFTTGNGTTSIDSIGNIAYIGGNATTIDTTASIALTLKVANGNVSANYETKLYGALVEII